MHHLFLPDCYVEQFDKINIEHLQSKNIKVLICDIDNTLAAHDSIYMNDVVRQFLLRVKEAGIEVALVSNNSKKRVTAYVGDHGYLHISSAKKPLSSAFRRVKHHFHAEYNEMAMLGDQLLTDILGANRLGIYTILTKPLVHQDLNWTKINRVVEVFIYKYLEKHYDFRKGVFYDN